MFVHDPLTIIIDQLLPFEVISPKHVKLTTALEQVNESRTLSFLQEKQVL